MILWVLDRVSSRQCHMRGLQDFTPSMASVSSNFGHRLSALKICLLIKLCSCHLTCQRHPGTLIIHGKQADETYMIAVASTGL